MTIDRWDHYTIRSKDIDASWRFYEQVLGLRIIERTGTPWKAYKAHIGNLEIVHCFQASDEMEEAFAKYPNSEDARGYMTGRIHHVEFWASDLDGFKARLTQHGVQFSERKLPDKYQVGMTDPDGIQVNLNFEI